MLINIQRYQKTLSMSGVRRPYRLRAGLWLALSMGLVGCAGAERPTGSADAGTELRQSQAPADMANAVQVAALAGAPPAPPPRSEESRVGKECVMTVGSRWWRDP